MVYQKPVTVYPSGYSGATRRWCAETFDGAVVLVGDIFPAPGDADLALNLAWKELGAENVKRVLLESEMESVAWMQ